MTHPQIKKVFHAEGAAAAEALETSRRRSEAALHWDFPLGESSLFCLLTLPVVTQVEKIYQQELDIRQSWLNLPPGARGHYIRSLLLNEVMFTNAIEGVQSTRRQIEDALEESNRRSPEHRRFRELSHLYLALGRGDGTIPTSVHDLSALYDRIMDGELDETDRPDGELFRGDIVDITDGGGRTVHRGFQPEAKIIAGLQVTLTALTNSETAPLVSAVMSHFMFECVHPFYDGNGRTGRYLLGLRLSELLSTATALTLSRTLHEDRRKYYRAFTDVEDPMNRGDGTSFAQMMLEAISDSQQELVADLAARDYLLTQLDREIERIRREAAVKPEHAVKILYLFGQVDLFGSPSGTKVAEVAEYLDLSPQQARLYLKELEELGFIVPTSRRPLRLVLSTAGRDLLGLPHPDTVR